MFTFTLMNGYSTIVFSKGKYTITWDRVTTFGQFVVMQILVSNNKCLFNINTLLAPYDVVVDFDTDVLPLSMDCEGGSVTERHLLFAVAKKLKVHLETYGFDVIMLHDGKTFPMASNDDGNNRFRP